MHPPTPIRPNAFEDEELTPVTYVPERAVTAQTKMMAPLVKRLTYGIAAMVTLEVAQVALLLVR